MSSNDYEVKLLASVDEHGWHATHVFDPEGNDPFFHILLASQSLLTSQNL